MRVYVCVRVHLRLYGCVCKCMCACRLPSRRLACRGAALRGGQPGVAAAHERRGSWGNSSSNNNSNSNNDSSNKNNNSNSNSNNRSGRSARTPRLLGSRETPNVSNILILTIIRTILILIITHDNNNNNIDNGVNTDNNHTGCERI